MSNFSPTCRFNKLKLIYFFKHKKNSLRIATTILFMKKADGPKTMIRRLTSSNWLPKVECCETFVTL